MKQLRQQSALKRLEDQLKSGVKRVRKDLTGKTTPLTDQDILRIQKEILILRSKIRVNNIK